MSRDPDYVKRSAYPFDGRPKNLDTSSVLIPRAEHEAAIAAEREKLAALRAEIATAERKFDAGMRTMISACGDLLRAGSVLRGISLGDAIFNSEDGA